MAQTTIRENKIFPIYNEDGTSFHNLVLRSATVETVVMSLGDKIYGDLRYQNNNLQFTMKEYIELDGVKYHMVSPPTALREGLVSDNSSEKGMTKYSFEFYHPMIMLSNLPFTDIAVTEEQGKYLSQNNVFSWIGKPADLVAKINKNLDGTVWCVRLNERFPEDKLNELSEVLPFNKVMISDVIKKFYEIWDVPFVVYKLPTTDPDYANGKEFVVEFGLPVSEILVNGGVFEFKFGQGVGLKNNSRTPRKNKIVTRISGAGSKNNIPYGYPQIQWYGDPNAEFTYGDHEGVYENVTIGEGGNAHTFAKLVSYPLYVGIVGGKPVKLIKHPFTREQLMPSIYSETVFNKVSPYGKRVVPEIRQQTTFQEALESVSEASYYWNNHGKHNFSHGLSEEFTDALNEVASKTTSDTVWIDVQSGYGYVQQDSYLNINAYFESRGEEVGAVFELHDVYNDTHNEPAIPNLDYDPDTEIIDFYDAVGGDPDYQYKNLIIPTQPSYETHDFEDIKPQFGSNRLIGVTPYSKENDSAITYQQLIENINNYKNRSGVSAFEKEQLNDLLEALDYNALSLDSSATRGGVTIVMKIRTIDNQHISVSFEDTNPDMTFYYYAQSKNYVEPEVTWDDTMDDNGKYNQSYFKITLPQLTFDIYASASITEEMSINMRSGACIGCTFKVDVDWDDYKRNFYDANGNFAPDGEQRNLDKYPKSNEQQITVIVQKDLDTFGTLMPNTYQQPKGETSEGSDDGDEFVVLGISMPQEYITSAESELDAAMKAFMLENNNHYFDYPLKFDEFFLTQNKNILNQIKPNSIIRFNYAGEQLELYVKQMIVKYGDKPLPQYDITLTDDIDVVKNEIGATIDKVERTSYLVSLLSQNYNKAGQQYADNKLSKVEDDVAQGVIGFLNGFWVKKNGVYGFDRDGNIVSNNITAQNILLESISAKNNYIQIDATDVTIGRETAVGLPEGNVSIYGTYKTYGAREYGGTPYSEYSINSIKFVGIYSDFIEEITETITTLISQVLSGDYAGRISINGSPVALISDINGFATQSWVQNQGYVSQDWATSNLLTKRGNQTGIWGYKRFTANESGAIPAFGNRTVEIANTGITFVIAPSFTQQQPPAYILTGGNEGLTINNGTTTEVIATRDWVGQQGYTTNNGTVTSVAMTVPTGFAVSGTPITTSGTFAITFASGYSLPTTAKQSQWDTAYGWGNHANAGYAYTSQLSSYLPLSGGTLTGALQLNTGADSKIILNNTDSKTYWSLIKFCQNGTQYGLLGTMGSTTLVWNNNTIWHAGNDGSGSGLDADLLDGQHGSYYAKASDVTTLQGYFTNGVANNADKLGNVLPSGYKTRIVSDKIKHDSGWYRILTCDGSSNHSTAFFITFFGLYHYTKPTPITFLINASYQSITIRQIGANPQYGFIKRIRAVSESGIKFHIDVKFENGAESVAASTQEISFEILPLDPHARDYISVADYSLITDSVTPAAEVECKTYFTSDAAGVLETARTLWGQSFNGSANVSGAMSGVTNIDSLLYFDTTNSRIGIGNSAPAYKLDVNGTLNASGTITQNGVGVLTMDGGTLNVNKTLTFTSDSASALHQHTLTINSNGISVDIEPLVMGALGKVFATDGTRLNYGTAANMLAYSNGTVCSNLNADLLDGKHASNFVEITSGAISGISSIDSLLNFDTTNSEVYIRGTNTVVSLNGSCLEVAKTLADRTCIEHDGLSYRTYGDMLIKRLKFDDTDSYKLKIETEINEETLTSEIITSDTIGSQSVASAATLTTSRTIWGQSFDGSGNISGDLSGVNHIVPSANITYSVGSSTRNFEAVFTRQVISYGTSPACHVGTSASSRISLHWSNSNDRGLFDYANSTGTWLIATDGTNTRMMFGNVGIGVESPTQKLHVNGIILADRTGYSTTTQVQLDPVDVKAKLIRGSNSAYFRLSATEAVYYTSIGTHHFKQAITCDSSVTATSHPTSSDERLKNVQDYFGEISIKDIAQAPAVRYTWNNGSDRLLHRGTIAQYWKKVTPECVVEDMDGYLAMQYDVIALLAAISLARKMQNHENRIQQLEEENKKLRELINNISNN